MGQVLERELPEVKWRDFLRSSFVTGDRRSRAVSDPY